MVGTSAGERLSNLWDDAGAAGLSEPQLLLYRSNLLGSDKRITNYGGGNTSAKVIEADPLGAGQQGSGQQQGEGRCTHGETPQVRTARWVSARRRA